MANLWRHPATWLLSATLAGCAITGPLDDESEERGEPWPGEPETPETAMAEANFDRHDVLDTASLEDADALTAAEIQAFLDVNPYGWSSVLANHADGGITAAQAFANAAQQNQINPLVLLTRVQMEQSLIGKSSASASTLDKAMGCGCPDNQPCSSQYQGFDKQVACAASKLRSYLDDMDSQGTTVAGWGIGITKTTLDGYSVTPVNEATAALYTYTPWVSAAKLHAKIWALYTSYVGYTGPSAPPPSDPADPTDPNDPSDPSDPNDPGPTDPNDPGPSDPSPVEIVIDDDPSLNDAAASFEASSSWTVSSATPGHHGSGYAYRTTGASSDLARFRFHLDAPATVVVEGWWTAGGNRASNAPFLVYDADDNHIATAYADQQANGSTWVELGTYTLPAGWNTVALSRWTSSGVVVIADAIRVREL